MGLILAGIIAAVLCIGFAALYMSKSKKQDEHIVKVIILLAVICIIGGFLIGIHDPISGYEEPQILSTTKLVTLRDEVISKGTGKLFYVSVSGANSYTYYVEVDSPYVSNSQKAYKSYTISSNNVTIVEDDSYTDAKLVTYVSYGKKTFWTFAVGAKEYEYVFYVPTGTIARNISLG